MRCNDRQIHKFGWMKKERTTLHVLRRSLHYFNFNFYEWMVRDLRLTFSSAIDDACFTKSVATRCATSASPARCAGGSAALRSRLA